MVGQLDSYPSPIHSVAHGKVRLFSVQYSKLRIKSHTSSLYDVVSNQVKVITYTCVYDYAHSHRKYIANMIWILYTNIIIIMGNFRGIQRRESTIMSNH